MTPDTRKFIDDSRAVCEAATKAPWSNEENYNTIFDAKKKLVCLEYDAEYAKDEARITKNFTFVAHARTALPAALDGWEAALKENDELRAWVGTLQTRIRELECADLDLRIAKNQALND